MFFVCLRGFGPYLPPFFAAEISNAHFEVEVIGNFPPDDARAFFEWRLQFSEEEGAPPLDDASWARIYEV